MCANNSFLYYLIDDEFDNIPELQNMDLMYIILENFRNKENIAIVAPSLLPMVHKLAAEIRNERATSLEQKIQILQKYKNIRGGQNLKPSKTRSSRNASTSDSRYTDRSKLKF